MKQTLYVRIIVVTMAIMLASGLIAFITTNVYYHYQLKPENDAKVTKLAESVVIGFEVEEGPNIDSYLERLTDLGYQFHLRGRDGTDKQYGDEFRSYELADGVLEKIYSGHTYHGIRRDAWRLNVTGFFENELSNTIGVPIEIHGETMALFVRPDTRQQFGEMRTFLAIVIVLMLLFSFLFILVSTRYIVNPVKQLAKATRTIAAGNYHVKLNVNRRDEIGRLAKDFSQMALNLSKTEEKRQEFVSNVSHEIQSPLTSINGFSQVLKEKDLPDDLREHYLSIIEKESKRLSMLSKQLLTLSFLDHGDEQDEWIRFDLNEQLKEVIATTRFQWEEKNLAIEIDTERQFIYGDPKLLQQVWMNLITNAIRYTEPNGTIVIRMQSDKEHVRVSVIDTGVGIPEESIPYVFERFYKVDTARVRTENSTGLGLAIVKKIIELHNGTIMVDSRVGSGTTFTCVLNNIEKHK